MLPENIYIYILFFYTHIYIDEKYDQPTDTPGKFFCLVISDPRFFLK